MAFLANLANLANLYSQTQAQPSQQQQTPPLQFDPQAMNELLGLSISALTVLKDSGIFQRAFTVPNDTPCQSEAKAKTSCVDEKEPVKKEQEVPKASPPKKTELERVSQRLSEVITEEDPPRKQVFTKDEIIASAEAAAETFQETELMTLSFNVDVLNAIQNGIDTVKVVTEDSLYIKKGSTSFIMKIPRPLTAEIISKCLGRNWERYIFRGLFQYVEKYYILGFTGKEENAVCKMLHISRDKKNTEFEVDARVFLMSVPKIATYLSDCVLLTNVSVPITRLNQDFTEMIVPIKKSYKGNVVFIGTSSGITVTCKEEGTMGVSEFFRKAGFLLKDTFDVIVFGEDIC
jgi:hypothetical protein